MPSLNPIATELTTAATDALLALLTASAALYLRGLRYADRRRLALWTGVLGLLAVASALGAVVHGLEMRPATFDLLWQPLYLMLGLVVALFAAAAAYDWRGRSATRALPWLLILAVAFYGATWVFEGAFRVFILYEAAAMAFALWVYVRLAIRRRPGAGLMAVGVALSLAAAAIQQVESISFTLIFPFDHNGAFHLVQIVAVVVLVAGLRAGARLYSHRAPERDTRQEIGREAP